MSIALSVLKHLTQLELSDNRWVSDVTMMIISASMSNLSKLNIAECDTVTDMNKSFMQIAMFD